MAEEDRNSIGFSQQVMDEAADALVSVGWSAPSSGEGELTSSDPFVQSIDASIQRDMGVRLDELLNPAKVRGTENVGSVGSCLLPQSQLTLPCTDTTQFYRLLIWNVICIIFDPSLPLLPEREILKWQDF